MKVRSNRNENGSEVYLDNVGGTYPSAYRQQVGDRTRYGVDVQGLPVSGNGWGELNTPLGTFRGGLSDDGVAGFDYAPPQIKGYSQPNGYTTAYIDNIAGMYPGIFRHQYANGETGYGAEIENVPFSGNGYKTINTPLGELRGGLSDDHVLGAEFTPNQYYIQALANLLRR